MLGKTLALFPPSVEKHMEHRGKNQSMEENLTFKVFNEYMKGK